MMAEVFELAAVHGQAAGVEEMNSQLKEGDEQEQMERRHGVHADLRGDLVQAETPGEEDDQKGGDSDGGADADDHSQCEAPSKTARGDASAHLAQQRAQNSAPDEVVNRFG